MHAMASHEYVVSGLVERWPRFLALMRGLNDDKTPSADDLLVFCALVAIAVGDIQPFNPASLWQDLWQSPEFCTGPDGLLASIPLLAELCKRLETGYTSPLLLTAVSTHLNLLGVCLEHAPAAQLSQLKSEHHALLRLLRDSLRSSIPKALSSLAGQGAGSGLGQAQQAGLESMGVSIHHSMLEAAANALRLEALAVRIAELGYIHICDFDMYLHNWAQALERAAACTWWEEGAESVALPMLLLQLASVYFVKEKMDEEFSWSILSGQGSYSSFPEQKKDLMRCLVRGALRYLRCELERCIQAGALEEGAFKLASCLFEASMLELFKKMLWSSVAANDTLLEAWAELLDLGHRAWKGLAQRPLAAIEPPEEAKVSQLKALVKLQRNLLSLQDHLYATSRGCTSPKLAQHCEAAQLQGAAAAADELRTAWELARVASEGGWSAGAQSETGSVVLRCAVRLDCHVRQLAAAGPSFNSLTAQRPDGSMAIAAALNAVRLAESLLRLMLGSSSEQQLLRQYVLHFRAEHPGFPPLPRTLCLHALSIAVKWAKGDISPAARAQQQNTGTPGLYLLGLTRDGSGLRALLSLLATLRKLAHALAQGVPLVEEQGEQEGFQSEMWGALEDLRLVALDMASACGGGGSAGSAQTSSLSLPALILTRPRSLPAGEAASKSSREQEAVLCATIPAGFYLVSCTTPGHPSSPAASEDGEKADPLLKAYTAVSVILWRCHRHNLLPCALRLGGGALLTRISQISWGGLPSRQAAELAYKGFGYCASQLGLIVAAVQGGLVQHAAETCLAWLQSDGFKANQANRGLLKEMHQGFLALCQAVQQAGLHEAGVDLMKWSQAVAEQDGGFITRFPKTNKEQAKAKEELLQAWGVRVRELCPHMWRVANAVLHAELAPFVEAGQLPEWTRAYSQRPLCGRAGAASLSAAIGAASSVADVASKHIALAALTIGKQEMLTLEAELLARVRGMRGSEEATREALAGLKKGLEMARASAAQAEAALPAGVRGGGEAAVEEQAPGSPDALSDAASRSPGPQAQLLSTCPAAYAFREVAVSQVGCANVHCGNLSGASESELPRLFCRGCLAVRYCSEGCGQADWARHGQVCRLLRMTRLGLAGTKPIPRINDPKDMMPAGVQGGMGAWGYGT